MSPLRKSCVYIVDDDDAFRSSAASIFGSASLDVVGYASAQAFLRDLDSSRPVCALVDIAIPDMARLLLQERLNGKVVGWLPVIFTTTTPDLQNRDRRDACWRLAGSRKTHRSHDAAGHCF